MEWRDRKKPHQNLHSYFTPDVFYHTKRAFDCMKVFCTSRITQKHWRVYILLSKKIILAFTYIIFPTLFCRYKISHFV